MTIRISITAGLALALLGACNMAPAPENYKDTASATVEAPSPKPVSEAFKSYWYAGVAEVSSYTLSQARYGELRDGNAVLVYVTEPFNPEAQVKADRPGPNAVSVLKLNRTKKFLTGIYPYSIMSSIFYPVGDHMHALKTTTSVQEWCGHVFTQLNNRDAFEVEAFSYFESEGDQKLQLPKSILEDELWTRLRIRPEDLPTGSLQVIPSLEYLRLKHKPIKAYQAEIQLSPQGAERTLTLSYPELERRLEIRFEGAFPHTILGWQETYPSGFGPGAEAMTTSAVLKKKLRSPYWSQNANENLGLRDSLGL
ncbi:septum formation inhibitor Maf [Robiginitalea sediminis]|uniref:septum formation inhibitor Maf n=1 Tax=Robiginitalea sediminis TaxID=1982593 RepID=UPI000B4A8804|nr:septum formation inhibitor Maf [Robiginitalea sediminis]